MYNFEIYTVTASYTNGRSEAYDLSNGVTIHAVGDGTAHDNETGDQYIEISREVAEDEFEFLGWAKCSQATAAAGFYC